MTVLSGKHHQRLFETEHLRADLRRRSVRGALVTLFAQGGSFCIQLAGTALLARILLPAEFGIFGKTLALTGFITVIRDCGLSLATVQRPRITHEQVSTIFWLNVAFGFGAAALMAGLSPLMAGFYGDPRVLPVGIALAGASFVSALGNQHAALLQRQMRFTALAVINLAGLGAGFATAIVAAGQGAGYWSLAMQQYASAIVMVALTFCLCRWLPGLPRRGTGVRPFVAVGAHQAAANVMTFAGRNLDNVLIGRYVSDAALGFYAQAYRLLMLPIQQVNNPVTSVVMPALSRLQDDPAKYAAFYYRAIGAMVFVGMPLVVFLEVEAEPLVRLLLGDGWLPSVAIFQALGIAAFFATFNVANGWVFMSLGRTDRQLRWQLVDLPVTVLAFAAGLPWGALGVAVAFSASRLLLRIPSLLYCFRGTPIRFAAFARRLARPALNSVVAGATLAAWHRFVHAGTPAPSGILLDSALYAGAYLLAWNATPSGRAEFRALVETLKNLRAGR